MAEKSMLVDTFCIRSYLKDVSLPDIRYAKHNGA